MKATWHSKVPLLQFGRIPIALGIIGLSSLTGCMTSPRNNQHIDNLTQMTFDGLVPTAGAVVSIDFFDYASNTWLFYGSITADTTASLTDSAGTPWYHYGKVENNQSLQAWGGSFPTHTMNMKVRPYIRGTGHRGNVFDPAHDSKVAFYDDATEATCIKAHESSSGANIVAACQSSAAQITVSASCGSMGQACCGTGWPSSTNYQCDSGTQCTSLGICGTCGASGQVPCHAGINSCYPNGGGQSCWIKCNSGLAYDPTKNQCYTPPTPPKPPARKTQNTAINCAGQTLWTGYPEFDCTLVENPSSQVKLVSITNPFTAEEYTAWLVKSYANASSVCGNPGGASSSQYVQLAPGATADLQSVLGSQPSISAPFTYALCLLPSPVDGSFETAYISDYSITYQP
jgi:hypothetical protein